MKRKLSRQDAIYSIALAGISAGLATLFIWLGVVVRYSTIAFFVAASLAVVVPMTRKYYVSSLIAYGVSAGLSFIISGDIVTVIGYIIYFGPIALLTGLFVNLKLKLWICEVIKLVFINGILPVIYFVFGAIALSINSFDIEYWMVALIGSICLMAIDFVFQICYKRLIPIMDKALRKSSTNESVEDKSDDDDDVKDPFDDGTFEG